VHDQYETVAAHRQCAGEHSTRRRYVRKRTEFVGDHAYTCDIGCSTVRSPTGENMMKKYMTRWPAILCGAVVALATGCANTKAPATTEVALSKAALENAAGAGGAEFAPLEMNAAREKIALANKAMAAKDYPLANTLATQAQADAKLAQGKANSAKAQAASDALQEDLRVLREELDRSSK
jgi:hypothetical protein